MNTAAPRALIVFDLVSTLTDAGPRYAAAYRETCRRFGHTPPDERDILRALGNRNLFQIVQEYNPDIPAADLPSFMAGCNQACDSLLYDIHWREDLYPHVRETLENLSRNGFALGIFTGTRAEALAQQLRYHNLLPYFDPLFVRAKNNLKDGTTGSADLKTGQLASIAAKAPEGIPVMVVGDSDADRRAAQACGMVFIGFGETEEKTDLLAAAGASRTFDNFRKLEHLIEDILAESAPPVPPSRPRHAIVPR